MQENQKNEEHSVKEDGMNHEMADKLDIMMDMIFKYIHDICYPNGKEKRYFISVFVETSEIYCNGHR